MPPVLGPASPSLARLKSRAAASGNGAPSVADGKDRQLFTLEQLLDVKARAECLNLRERGLQLVVAETDEHALAGGEAVGLDDARRSRDGQRARGRHARPLEHVLRERLRPLDARARRGWAEDRDAAAAQAVREPGDERRFGTDDDEVDAKGAREREHAVAVLGQDGMAAAELRDARVARRRMQLLEPGALGDLPRESVLASTRADDEHPHDYDPAMPGDEPAAPPYSATAVDLTRFPGGEERDLVAVEEPLEIRVDGAPVAVTMRTPGNDEELALGFCLSEGIGPPGAALPADLAANTVDVDAPGFDPERLRRSFYVSSSCGVCGKGAHRGGAVERRRWRAIFASRRRFSSRCPSGSARPRRVRGDGRAARGRAFAADGTLLCVREDVGRHNAVDKVLGWAFLEGRLPLADCVLCLSGRIAFELVQKAAVAGCPIVVAVGAPSSLAVELAGDRGITLCGFARDGRMNVYSEAWRVET